MSCCVQWKTWDVYAEEAVVLETLHRVRMMRSCVGCARAEWGLIVWVARLNVWSGVAGAIWAE